MGRKRLAVGLGVLAVLALLFASTFRASPLPAPAPYAGELPHAAPPPGMHLLRLPTGVTHRNAAFAYRGGSFSDKRDFAMAGMLVKHPRGDVLIDTGLGKDIDAQFAMMPFWFRAVTRYTRGRSAAEQLDAAHYDRPALRAILLTHAHWDHVSGVPEFPGTPVWVPEEERAFIEQGGWITEIARSTRPKLETYTFEGGPYLGFAKSHDVWGDGSIVVVPAPGHTPGSVIVFVTVPDGRRYAFVGDLVWQREGITEREEKPWLQRTLADSDPPAVRALMLHVAAITARFPEVVVVPAHDARALAALPVLPNAPLVPNAPPVSTAPPPE